MRSGRIRLHFRDDIDQCILCLADKLVAALQPQFIFTALFLKRAHAFLDIGLQFGQLFGLQGIAGICRLIVDIATELADFIEIAERGRIGKSGNRRREKQRHRRTIPDHFMRHNHCTTSSA